MAKAKAEEVVEAPVEEAEVKAPVSDREARWAEHLANYKEINPVKYESKKANGEFDNIPADFV